MPLSVHARRMLAVGLGSQSAADEVVTVIDADGGTLSTPVRERIVQAVGNRQAGDLISDAIDADTALGAYASEHLRHILDTAAFAEIDAELGA